jgi:hypothetical protein
MDWCRFFKQYLQFFIETTHFFVLSFSKQTKNIYFVSDFFKTSYSSLLDFESPDSEIREKIFL